MDDDAFQPASEPSVDPRCMLLAQPSALQGELEGGAPGVQLPEFMPCLLIHRRPDSRARVLFNAVPQLFQLQHEALPPLVAWASQQDL